MPQTPDSSTSLSAQLLAQAHDRKETATPAHFGLRLVAAAYDLLPLLALWFVAAVIALLVTGGALDVRRPGDKLLMQVCILALTALYFIASWLRGGQTVGMRAWRLRVVAADGTSVKPSRALLRFAVALVALAAGGLGFFWCLIDSERRGWHDIVAGTLLVRMEKQQG